MQGKGPLSGSGVSKVDQSSRRGPYARLEEAYCTVESGTVPTPRTGRTQVPRGPMYDEG